MWPVHGRRFNLRIPALVTPPAAEPVSLADAKAFLKVDSTDDDNLITLLISSARRSAEEYAKRSFITQTWKLTMDGFDVHEDDPPYLVSSNTIDLPRGPVQSVSSLTTIDLANQSAVFPSASYTLDTASGRILLTQGYTSPSNLRADAAVEVLYVTGYGASASSVPGPIRQAILLHVGSLYENRQCGELGEGAKALLDGFRAPEAFGQW